MQQEDPVATPPITVFYSYASEDEVDQQLLEMRLRLLRKQGLIADWHQGMISAGGEAKREIDAHLETAQIILLLLSADYLASDNHFNIEMPRALQRRANGEARVIPILLRPCEWEESPLADLQPLPANDKPISQWKDRDAAFLDVARSIRAVVEKLIGRPPSVTVPSEQELEASVAIPSKRPRNYIPFPRNPLFQPRSGEFERLERLLFGSETQQPSLRIGLIGMIGMGGVGKTQLAVQLAYRYEQRFPAGVFWMTATGRSHFDWQRRLADLAARIDYFPPSDDPSNPENELRRARHFCRYLADHAQALLILDNVEDPALVTSVLPALAGSEVACSILYTSRNRFAPPGVATHSVEQLSAEAALRLLLETTRSALLTEVLADSQQAEALAARAICRGVGYLPLALVHLRGLLARDQRLTLVRLAHVLEERGALEVANKQYLDAAPLFATIELSWKQMQDEATQQFFKLASYFPEATPIPLWLLGLATGLGESSDILEPLGESLLQLQELSLVEELSEEQVRLHPLVREFGRRLVTADGDKSKTLQEEAGERLVIEFENLSKLEERARREGFWGFMDQVREARAYASLLGTDKVERLNQVEHWLDREMHLLGNEMWWPEVVPGLFYQQLYNRALEEGQWLPQREVRWPWIRQLMPVGCAANTAPIRTFAGHRQGVNSVAFSPGGTKVLTGSADGTAQLWEMRSGKPVQVFKGHQGIIYSVAFSPDGTKVLTGSADKTARLWEVESGETVKTLEGHQYQVLSVAFSPDGKKILTGSTDGTARLWDAASGNMLMTLEGHQSWVSAVAFSPDGTKILTRSNDKTVCLWQIASGKRLMTLKGHQKRVESVAFSSDGTKVLTGSGDKTARLWNAGSGELLVRYKGHQNWVHSATFSPDGTKVLTGSSDGTARLWDAASGKPLTFEAHHIWIQSAAFSPDGTKILTGGEDGTARLWNAVSERLSSSDGHTGEVEDIVFSPDGARVLTGSKDGTTCLWEVASGRLLARFESHQNWVHGVAFSPDGSKILTGSFDRTARLWNATSGQELAVFRDPSDRVESVAFSPDGMKILTGSTEGMARLWEVASGEILAEFEGHQKWVSSVAFSPDGKKILTGSEDKTARLWDVASGKQLMTFKGHRKGVESVAFSPDGKKILTGSYDRTAHLWETERGKLLAKIEGHEITVRKVAFSPNGHLIITCDRYGQVRFWQLRESVIDRLQGIYSAIFEIGDVYWQDNTHVLLADTGGPHFHPHFYHLKLEGM